MLGGRLMSRGEEEEGAERLEALVQLVTSDNRRMRKAGNHLAAAAVHVVQEYDGLHRLALAVSEWMRAVADEGGRGELYGPGGEGGEAECLWTEDQDDGKWDTDCGESFVFTTDGPMENGMDYCCYCGGGLITARAVPTTEGEAEE
jgi:hypothetical protein